jgi:hypothetical protein
MADQPPPEAANNFVVIMKCAEGVLPRGDHAKYLSSVSSSCEYDEAVGGDNYICRGWESMQG